jgi:hypothetical protein
MRKRWTSILAMGTALSVFLAGGAVAYKPTIITENNWPLFFNGGFTPTKLPKKRLAPAHLALEGSELLAGPAALKKRSSKSTKTWRSIPRAWLSAGPGRLICWPNQETCARKRVSEKARWNLRSPCLKRRRSP